MKKPLASRKCFDLPVIPEKIEGSSLKAIKEPCSNGRTFNRLKKVALEISPEIADWIRGRCENKHLQGRALGKRRIALYGNPEAKSIVSSNPKLVVVFIVNKVKYQPSKDTLLLNGFIPVSSKVIRADIRFTGDSGTITL